MTETTFTTVPDGMRLLKYDGNGDPVFVTEKEYMRIMRPAKQRSKRVDKNKIARKKQTKKSRKANRK